MYSSLSRETFDLENSMSKIASMFILISFALFGCKHEEKSHNDKTIDIYKYTYQYNSDNLIEDHYIVLEKSGNTVNGWYYGTSDDFDETREGYLPGFYVKEMEELKIDNDTIKFKLNVKFEECYSKPISLEYKNINQLPKSFHKWDVGSMTFNPRNYEGTIVNDKIIIGNMSLERVFIKIMR